MASLSVSIRRTLGVQCEFYVVLILPILILQFQFDHGSSQQAYFNNDQYDCYTNHTNTLGYTCNGPLHSCTSYLTIRTTATYSTVPSIAYLLSANATSIADANNVTDFASFPEDHLLYVPVNCSCSSKRYYQHNATYKLKASLETYLTVANDTYEGLTTCQSMMSNNAYDSYDLDVGDVLVAPLMCACPSTNQTHKGFNYIVSYLADWDDDVSTVATLFGVDEQRIYDANGLDSSSTIYPYNPILVPLETTPSRINLNPSPSPSPSPSSPPPPPTRPSSASTSSKKWVFVGIGIGAATVTLPVFFLIVFLLCRRKRKRKESAAPSPPRRGSPPAVIRRSDMESGGNKDISGNSWSLPPDKVRYAIESLTIYRFESLQKATGDFSESNRIKGSVFRGDFYGDAAAVKVLNGDVSGEINILKQINHSNIIRLSGFCVHQGHTYLVYEFVEKGSLRDLLLFETTKDPSLDWKQRVQIAYGIAEGLNYLHNYCSPPYVHKNLSSSSVLLDANLRAKITNFGLARTVPEEDDEDGGGLMHLTKHVVGTKGYLAPEYIENGLVTPKMDVYAFGMVVLELLSGRTAAVKASENKDDEMLTAASITEVLQGDNVREKLRRFMDGGLTNLYPFDLAYSMAQLAKMCVAPDLNSRLSISEVLAMLSKIHSLSLDWDPSDELDRSSSLTQGR